jgi:hypothetical protein
MAATDPQSLITQAKCYLCYNITQFQGMKLALLAQVSLTHNPANNVTPQGLIDQSKCFACFSTADLGKMMELALLAQIAT